MGTLNDDLSTLQTARDNMKTALESKGQSVTNDIRTYAIAIGNINQGADLNIFTQTTEPISKNGIWVNTNLNKDINFIVSQDIELASALSSTDITLPVAFTKGQTAIINNDLWIVVGQSIYSYNLNTKQWTQHTNLPYTTNFSNSGYGNTLQYDEEYLYIPRINSESSLQIMKYKMSDDSCETKSFSISTNVDPAGVCLTENGYLYYAGWQTTPSITAANVKYRYGMAQLNYSNGTVTTKTHVPTTHCYAENVVAKGNKVYLIGSANAESTSPTSVSRYIYVYNTLDNTYEHIYTSSTNIWLSSSVVYKDYIICMLQSNRKVLIINTKDNSVYWSTITIDNDFTYGQIAVHNNTLYVIGGSSNTTGVKTAKIIVSSTSANTINIVNPNSKADYYVKLISNSDMITGVNDVVITDANGDIDSSIDTYYGNGTNWIQIT